MVPLERRRAISRPSSGRAGSGPEPGHLVRPGPLRRALLAWYRQVMRPLPWRTTTDPYRVWISEIMLQQTTVKTVVPYYERFLAAFPTVRDLARSPLDDVLARWSGLGYYSRARHLHAAARAVVADHGGRFPRDPEAALALPGIGRYTAAAILSISAGAPLPVLDGNVTRVLCRLFAVGGPPKSGVVQKRLWEMAGRLLDPGSPGDFNQAMMELGATLCRPVHPRCAECPLAAWCEARRAGEVDRYPEAARRAKSRGETMVVAVIERKGRVLLRRRQSSEGLMPGLWELPGWPLEPGGDPAAELSVRLPAEIGAGARVAGAAGEVRHTIMNRRIRLLVFHARLPGASRPRRGWRWVPAARLGELAVSSMVGKVLAVCALPGRPRLV